ncbi:hypothetical protein [Paenibacillus lactis]
MLALILLEMKQGMTQAGLQGAGWFLWRSMGMADPKRLIYD